MAKIAALEARLHGSELPYNNSQWGSARRHLLVSVSAVALAAAIGPGQTWANSCSSGTTVPAAQRLTNGNCSGVVPAGAGNATATGHSSTASGSDSTAYGQASNAGGSNSNTGTTAIGQGAQAGTGVAGQTNATAVGQSATANASSATAVGQAANASATNATAVGQGSIANASGAAAFGQGSRATSNSTAVGQTANAGGTNATSTGNTAVGQGSQAGTTAVGQTNATALGINTRANAQNATAVGQSANASALATTAIGSGANAINTNATAVGVSANATGSSSAAYGAAAVASSANAAGFGQSANATGTASTAVGSASRAGGTNSTALGQQANASGLNGASGTTAIGSGSQAGTGAGQTNATAVGQNTFANAAKATAVGQASNASGTSSAAFGSLATASGASSVAVGDGANAAGTNSVAIGKSSTAKKIKAGTRLARRLKFVLDHFVWFDLSQVSGESLGHPDDGLTPDAEEVGSITTSTGVEEPVRLVRIEGPDGARWVFSAATVARVNHWFGRLPDRWFLDHLPTALLRMGPFELLYWQWIALPAALLAAWFAGWFLARVTRGLLARLAARTRVTWDDAVLARIGGPLTLAWLVVVLHVLLPLLGLSAPAEEHARQVLNALLFFTVFWALMRSVDVLVRVVQDSPWTTQHPAAYSLIPLGGRVLKLVVLALAFVSALSELGFPVASLIAGLGIGGLALALAAQKTVENLVGAFSIGVDQPMKTGDFVRIGEHIGNVEQIGLRSTRIRTLDRTLVTIPNAQVS